MYPRTPPPASLREQDPGVPADNIDIDAYLVRFIRWLMARLRRR